MTFWVDSSLRQLARTAVFLTTLATCSAICDGADAQSIYYRSIPIGERAIGLGGAFAGVASDPSAAYHNPAGIMSGGRFQLLGSFTSLVFIREKVDNAFGSPSVDADFVSKRTSTLPRFIGTVVKFGRKRFGDHQFALAYSTLEVDRNEFNAGSIQSESASSLDLRLSNNYNSRWYGVSFAAHATKKTSLGFTAFVAQQRGFYSEDIGIATGGALDETGLRVGGDSVTSNTSLSIQSWDILLRLGVLHRFNRRWQLGVSFQTPGVPVSRKGDVFRRLTSAVSGGESAYFLFDQGDFSPRAPIPWELRAGFEYQANSLTMLAFDAAVAGPVRDRKVFDVPPALEGEIEALGTYFANSTERRWTPNVAIGAEHLFGKVVVAGGLFTNISAAPNVPAVATEYTPDQVDVWGASFSVGLDTKGYRLTVGANGYFGRGDALAARLDRDTTLVSYDRTRATISAVVIYIAGAVSVATKGAKDAQQKIKQKKSGNAERESADGLESDTENSSESGSEDATPSPEANPSSPSVE